MPNLNVPPPPIPDFARFYQLAATLAHRCRNLATVDVRDMLADFNRRVVEIETVYKFDCLAYACATDKRELQLRHERWLNELPSYARAKAAVYHRLRALRDDKILSEVMPAPELLAQAVAIYPLDREQIASELKNVDALQQFFYQLSFSDGQTEFAVWDKDLFFAALDKRRRHIAYQSVAETLLAEQRQLLNLYRNLIRDRHAQARAGNLQYRALRAISSGHSDLGIRELEQFRELAGDLLKPVVVEILKQRRQRLGVNLSYADRLLFVPERILETLPGTDTRKVLIGVLQAVLGEAAESFLKHLIAGNYSESAEIAYWLGESAVVIPAIPLVYLYLPHSSNSFTVNQLFGISGYALADVSAMLNFPAHSYVQQPHLIKEVSSIAMSFIGSRYTSRFFEQDQSAADLYNDMVLSRELCRACELLALDEFEDRLYGLGDLPPDADQIWLNIWRRYYPAEEEAEDNYFAEGKAWQLEVNHLIAAYSSLHRVLALITVLAEMPHFDRRSHLEKKLNKLLLSHPSTPLLQRLKRAGFSSPLEPQTIKRAVFAAADILEI